MARRVCGLFPDCCAKVQGNDDTSENEQSTLNHVQVEACEVIEQDPKE